MEKHKLLPPWPQRLLSMMQLRSPLTWGKYYSNSANNSAS